MRLRTQLILAFLLLAVVPLGAITVYSYRSSARALRRTVENESARMAGEMNDRMGAVTANLSRRIDMLESLPIPEPAKAPVKGGQKADPLMVGRVVAALGEAAEFVDSFEFTQDPPQSIRPKVVVHLPRIVGRMVRDPKLQPILKMAGAFLPPAEAERIRKEIEVKLGKGGDPFVQALKEALGGEINAAHAATAEVAMPKEESEPAEDMDGAVPSDEEEGPPQAERDGGQAPTAEMELNQEFSCPLKRNGQTVGHLKARVSADRLLRQVLSMARRDQGEIPFALDADGRLFTPDPRDRPTLLSLEKAAASGRVDAMEAGAAEVPAANPHTGDHKMRIGLRPDENWIVVTREDPATGLVFGIARPVGAALGEIRRASARNLGAGLGLAALALFGIVPISRRMTHNLSDLTHAAGELAAGRLDTQVPVRSTRDELGRLALAFNRMARELAANQGRLVEQERLRKELELCRRIQSELLPKHPMSWPFAQVQGLSIPARELGGDFFNYFDLPGGEVALFMGDVSGKGIPAALLMANLQATLRARVPLEPDLAAFARDLDREIEASTPPEVYVTLFLGVLDPKRSTLRYVNAGHETPFVLRAAGPIERLESTGRPIGLMAGGDFAERSIMLEAGDRLFLYTDGVVDAENSEGAAFGPSALELLLSRPGPSGPADLLARVERAYQEHRGSADAADDATFLVLEIGAPRVARGDTSPLPPPIVADLPPPSATV